jgi:hypothetical protein
VLRSFAMRALRRLVVALPIIALPVAALLIVTLLPGLLLAAAAVPARAQATVEADSGRFIVFQGDVPIARERNVFQWMGDSLVITAETRRTMQDEQGTRLPFHKYLAMVVDSRDLGLRSYTSIQEFRGHKMHRGLVPGDTSISYYEEFDGAGDAMRVPQPPGRLFVMDSQLFTLFEVLCRGLANKTFTSRSVQLVALADSMTTPVATVTRDVADTLRFGTRRVPARRYTLTDPTTEFVLWADARGRMIQLTHALSGLRVEREPDPAPPVRRRTRPKR